PIWVSMLRASTSRARPPKTSVSPGGGKASRHRSRPCSSGIGTDPDVSSCARWREERARVFFALWPDAETAHALHQLARSAHAGFGGRVMRRDTLHLTLAFIGGVPRLRIPELLEVGAAVTPRAFELSLDVLGEWMHKHIVWAGPGDAPKAMVELSVDLH